MPTYGFNSEFVSNFMNEQNLSNYQLRKKVNGNARTVARWFKGGDMRTNNLIDMVNILGFNILDFFYADDVLMSDIDKQKDERIAELEKKLSDAQKDLQNIKKDASHTEVIRNTDKKHQQETLDLLRSMMKEQQEQFDRREETERERYQQELREKDKTILQIQMEKNEELLQAKEEIIRLKEELRQLTAQYRELELSSGTYTGTIGLSESPTKKPNNKNKGANYFN